jgi:hypothetical protein
MTESPDARLLTRDALAAVLTERGFPIKAKTLSTLASRPGKTGGPAYRLFGRTPVYCLDDALEWARARLMEPSRGKNPAPTEAQITAQ